MEQRERRIRHTDISAQVLQRIYKYGGQPFVRDYLATHYGSDFDKTFGKGTGKAIMHATAGRYGFQSGILCDKIAKLG
jgi:hypothetical protein